MGAHCAFNSTFKFIKFQAKQRGKKEKQNKERERNCAPKQQNAFLMWFVWCIRIEIQNPFFVCLFKQVRIQFFFWSFDFACFWRRMIMGDTESCSSRAVDFPPIFNRNHRLKVDIYNEVLRRLKDLNVAEANLAGFEDNLWSHFLRLPTR